MFAQESENDTWFLKLVFGLVEHDEVFTKSLGFKSSILAIAKNDKHSLVFVSIWD